MIYLNFKKILHDTDANAVPLILFILTIVLCGGLYSIFFIEVIYPNLLSLVPASDTKTLISMFFYAIPLFVLVVGVISLLKAGMKQTFYGGFQ